MDYIGAIFMLVGATFIFLAGLGLLRMPDLYLRMQVASKAPTLGIILMVIAVIVKLPTWESLIKGVFICLFLMLTVPVAAHAIALAKQDGKD